MLLGLVLTGGLSVRAQSTDPAGNILDLRLSSGGLVSATSGSPQLFALTSGPLNVSGSNGAGDISSPFGAGSSFTVPATVSAFVLE